MQTLGWGFPAERLAWAAVEFGCDGVQGVQVLAVVHRKVGVDRSVGRPTPTDCGPVVPVLFTRRGAYGLS